MINLLKLKIKGGHDGIKESSSKNYLCRYYMELEIQHLFKEEKTMKKLEKRFNSKRNTVESYVSYCKCACPCNYCAATYEAQYNADSRRESAAKLLNK